MVRHSSMGICIGADFILWWMYLLKIQNLMRLFIYAGDIARGIIAAMNTDKVNAVYNLSNQTETSLLKLIDLLAMAAGKNIKPKFAAPREDDINRSMLCNEAALHNLSWKPEMDLAEGVARTVAYFKEC